MYQMHQKHRSNIIIQGRLKKNENEFVGRIAITPFDWLRVVSEVEPPEAGERGRGFSSPLAGED